MAFATAVVKHSHRWERIVLKNFHDYARMAQLLSKLRLPILQDLIVPIDEDKRWDETNNPSPMFIQTWTMPSLRNLVCDNAALRCRITSRLDTFRFHSTRKALCILEELAQFIASPSASRLRELTLDCEFWGNMRNQATFPDGVAKKTNAQNSIQLEQLQMLIVKIGGGIQNNEKIITDVVGLLRSPNISSITLDLNVYSGINAFALWLDWLKSQTFAKLKNARLLLRGDAHDVGDVKHQLIYAYKEFSDWEFKFGRSQKHFRASSVFIDQYDKEIPLEEFCSRFQGFYEDEEISDHYDDEF